MVTLNDRLKNIISLIKKSLSGKKDKLILENNCNIQNENDVI